MKEPKIRSSHIHPVDFRQQLVHQTVPDRCTARAARASLLANGVDLVHDDYVQLRVFALGFLLSLGSCEEVADVFFRLAHVLVEHLGAGLDLKMILVLMKIKDYEYARAAQVAWSSKKYKYLLKVKLEGEQLIEKSRDKVIWIRAKSL